jgi:hypothetical protein
VFFAGLGQCGPCPFAFKLRLLHQEPEQQSIEMLTEVIFAVVTGFDAAGVEKKLSSHFLAGGLVVLL